MDSLEIKIVVVFGNENNIVFCLPVEADNMEKAREELRVLDDEQEKVALCL